ncbi:DNA ligase/mRNA capping enzyme, partial [Exidia glandulosa HHB12029]
SNATYTLKRTGDCYRCECWSWRTAGGPNNARSCKHLRELLGDAYEDARCESNDPVGFAQRQAKKASKRKGRTTTKSATPGMKKATVDDDAAPKKNSTTTTKRHDGLNKDTPQVPALLLAQKWNPETSPKVQGWWCSEKLDGVRAFYNKTFVSRLGNQFHVPNWFLKGACVIDLPTDVALDGELFMGRGKFNETVSIVRAKNSPRWGAVKFHVFDIPSHAAEPFEERLKLLEKFFGEGGSHACDHVVVVKQTAVKDRDHVLEMLQAVEAQGGEGLMLRKPKSYAEFERQNRITFYDAEARVTGYSDGKGKYDGLCGALICEMESGKTFKCGSGLTNKDRASPPAIDSIIVYRFQELTLAGRPRFPTFVGAAADKSEPRDADLTKELLDDGEAEM